MKARPCVTRKRRYRDAIDARFALALIQARDDTRRPKTELREYECPICHGWHLTSQRRK